MYGYVRYVQNSTQNQTQEENDLPLLFFFAYLVIIIVPVCSR